MPRYQRDQTIHRVFVEQAASTPNHTAIVLAGRRGAPDVALTYAELDRASSQLAAVLRDAGVTEGTMVATLMERSLESIIAFIGILKAGGAYVPLDPDYPAQRLAFMIEDTAAPVLLTQSGLVGDLPPTTATVIQLDEGWADEQRPTFDGADATDGASTAYVIYTSGSTGRPKGVIVPHRAVVRLVVDNHFTPLNDSRVFLQLAPVSFDAATLEIWGPLLNGGTCVLYPHSGVPDFDELGAIVERTGVTSMWLTSSLFNLVIDRAPHVIDSVAEVLTGGEALSVPHIRKALDLLPNTQLVNGYGPTESTTFTCCYRIPRELPSELASIPIGTAINNTTVHILDESRKPVADGEIGDLHISGDGLADGYLNRPELTAERFVDGMYWTGDKVRRLPDGTIEFHGRVDDQVKIRGHRIELGEIETALSERPEIERAVVLAREDEPGEKRLVAYVTAAGDNKLTAGGLRAALERRLPDYMVPGSFVILDALPLSPTGKVDRPKLPKPGRDRPELQQPYAPPRDDLERLLCKLWSATLDIEPVGIHDRFFELGGTSLQAVRFVTRLSEELGKRIPIVALFDAPTIALIADVVRADFVGDTQVQQERPRVVAHDDAMEIAIVGMAGRFPYAPDIEAFWENLRNGRECNRPVTADDLERAGLDPHLVEDEDYVASSFTLDEAEFFDAAFFGFKPREAELMDPQQRLFIETAYAALEHAGYDPDRFGGKIGVFGGVGRNPYLLENIARRGQYADRLIEHSLQIGNERDFPATHVAYRLNLRGPAVNIQTACSTSGVALHVACQSLRDGDCDMAIVGGCKVLVPNHAGYMFVDGGALACDGHVRAFDANAGGMVRGSGCGMIVVKPLARAQADGDHIWGIVRGTAINNDGSAKIGFTAPSVGGQAAVITRALDRAGLRAEDISYVETHGTGTVLGDPIEVAGLTRAYRRYTEDTGFCAIGSVKTNIGHLDAGALVAGIIKTLLALDREAIPPSLNFETPNPEIDFDSSPFYVAKELIPWKRSDKPRRAGVSSFGLGGTNAHVVLEESPVGPEAQPGRDHQLLLLSAKTTTALATQREQLAAHLEEHGTALPDAAYTLAKGRRRMSCRAAIVAEDGADARAALVDPARVDTRDNVSDGVGVAFMFPGGGAQYVDMARGLYEREPVFRSAVDECARLIEPDLGMDLRKLIYLEDGAATGRDSDAAKRLQRPSFALPTLFTIEYAVSRLLDAWGVKPTAVIGHSMGEYTAACLAGVMSLADALRVVHCRGTLFEKLPRGGMLSVPLASEDARRFMPPALDFAAINHPTQCVVSGATDAIEAMQQDLERAEIESTRIRIDVAAHSQLVEPILGEFGRFMQSIDLHEPTLPIISNVAGGWADSQTMRDPDYWVEHLRRTVRFADGVGTLLGQGTYAFVEVGPGRTLASFAKAHPERRGQLVAPTLRHPKVELDDLAFLLRTIGQLWTAGVDVDHDAFYAGQERRRVPLPTYPFERKRYYLARPTAPLGAGEAAGEPAAAPDDPQDKPAAPLPMLPANATREDRIVYEIKLIISGLSGLDPAQIDADATFLELGFDSLFLTQANGAFRKKFGVKTKVRHLLEKTPGVAALAKFIDAELPGTEMPTGKAAAAPAASKARTSDDTGGEAPTGKVDKESPWQPVQAGADGQLPPEQQAHLDALIEAVCKRAPKSKEMTQEHRGHFADPRTVQGFKLQWKEIVFPIIAEKTYGSKLWDVDGNEYIDLVNGYGVTLLGHNPEFIRDAVKEQLERGVEIGPQNYLAGKLARLVCDLTGMDRAAFCNTGSEAVLAAIRLARTVKNKFRIATFAGHYHGIFDEVLVKGVNFGGNRRTVPIAPGMPPWAVENTLVMKYGDPESLDLIREHADELALVLVEPVRSRNPALRPVEFVRELRKVTEECDVALLFDEMVTGFRAHPGGMQAIWDIRADLATYGKVVGGGFPIGVVTGKAEYMDALDGGYWGYDDESVPEADMTWFAGTFVRHPVAMAAAYATLSHLQEQGPALQERLNARVDAFAREMNAYFQATGTPIWIEHWASFIVLKFTSFQEYSQLLFYHLHNRGIFTYEGRPAFFTTAHSDEDIAKIKRALIESIQALQEVAFLPGKPLEIGVRTIPMSAGQQEIWLATRFGPDASCAFNLASTLELEGALDVDDLRSAIRTLAMRHQALRCLPNDDGSTQRVFPSYDAEIPYLEASGDELEAIRQAEVTTEFDFRDGPLFRAKIVKTGEDRHLVILTAHHIIADGWSCGLMCRELGRIYGGIRSGAAPDLAEAMAYEEFIALESSEEMRQQRQEAEDYWFGQYEGGPVPVLDLPTDRPRPPIKTFTAARANLQLDSAFTAGLRKLAASQGATLFATVLSGFHVLMARLSGEADTVVGFSLAGQADIEDKALCGHCVQFLPLRLSLEANTTFGDHIRHVRSKLFDALENKNFTFGTLIQRLNVPRDPSRVPLMSVAFNLDPHSLGMDFHDLSCEAGSIPRRYENFDIFFNLVESPEGIEVQCTYNVDLFDHETMVARMDQYKTILAEAVDDQQRSPYALPLIDQQTRHELIVELNQTDAPFAADKRIDELVAAHPADGIAVVAGDTRLTYGELEGRANRVAAQLRERGVGHGDRVGIAIPRSAALLVALLGVLKAGAAYVPIDPSLPQARVDFMVRDAELDLVLGEDDIGDGSAPAGATEATAESVAYVTYTSGSTGTPKGVMVPHRAVVAYLSWANERYGMAADGAAPVHSSIGFDLTVTSLFGPLVAGGTVHLLADEDDVEALGRALSEPEQRFSVVKLTPAHLTVLSAQLTAEAAARLECTFVVGGEQLRAEQLTFLREHATKARIVNEYGPTEATVGCCIYEAGADDPATGVVPIGKPSANAHLYILDERRQPVPVGVAGELYIGGPQVALGYLNRPEETAERFVHSPFIEGERLYRTGDMARHRRDGNIEFVGRNDGQVKVRGYRIELGEIESLLEGAPEVERAVVLASDDALRAYVVPAKGTSSQDEEWKQKWDALYQAGAEAVKGKEDAQLDDLVLLRELSDKEGYEEEVQEGLDATFARLRELPLDRVLAIGAGSGAVLLRLAPHCKQVHGTDYAAGGIAEIHRLLETPRYRDLDNVTAEVRDADDFDGLDERGYSAAIINSVCQYFPSAEYFERVLEGAIDCLADDGVLFVGDVQSCALLEAHHSFDQLERASEDTSAAELRDLIQRRMATEPELVVDPTWFQRFASKHPRVGTVQCRLRRGRIQNETTRFHYDVWLELGEAPKASDVTWRPWAPGVDIGQFLRDESPEVLCICGIPNWRNAMHVEAMRAIRESDDRAGAIRSGLSEAGVDPEALWSLADELPYDVDLRWSDAEPLGSFDAVFVRRGAEIQVPQRQSDHRGPLFNLPAQAQQSRQVASALGDFLRDHVPEYMVPASIQTVAEIPLTPNGKVDGSALRSLDLLAAPEAGVFVEPSTDTERTVAEIWSDVLGIERVSADANFFELGGHSLLGIQVIVKLRDVLTLPTLSLSSLFAQPTVATLATKIDAQRYLNAKPTTDGDREEITF